MDSLVPGVQRTLSSPPPCGISKLTELDDGAIERFLNTSDSAWSIVNNIINGLLNKNDNTFIPGGKGRPV